MPEGSKYIAIYVAALQARIIELLRIQCLVELIQLNSFNESIGTARSIATMLHQSILNLNIYKYICLVFFNLSLYYTSSPKG